MDKNGNGKLLELARLTSVTELSFSSFSYAMFTQMCILSGCDYTPSIRGMGLKKAHRLLMQSHNPDQVYLLLVAVDVRCVRCSGAPHDTL